MAAARLPLDVFRTLTEATRLSTENVEDYVRRAQSIPHWRRLCPWMSIGAKTPASRQTRRSRSRPANASAQLRHLRERGYFQIDGALRHATIDRMRRSIEVLKRRGWPPVFAFVYDDFWNVWRAPTLVAFIDAALGPGCRLRTRFWSYYVHATRGAKGWPPHADGYGTDGLSVWIALSDATLDNGCMYVVPRDLIGDEVAIAELAVSESLPVSAFVRLMQSARPLTASAGSVLGWAFDVIHWGGGSHGGEGPRISVSAEFVPKRSNDGEASFADWRTQAPDFRQRLALIARNLCLFGANDAWTFKYVDVGRRLLEVLDHTP